MSKKMYKSEKNALLFDVIYTAAVSVTAIAAYLVGSGIEGADLTYLGIFVLGAYMLFMLTGIVIRTQLFSGKMKNGGKTELYNIASLFFGKMHLQLAVVNAQGEVIISNDTFRESFLSHEKRHRLVSIYDLFKFPAGDNHIFFEDGVFSCEYEDRIFDVTASRLGESGNYVLIFEDRTERRTLRDMYERARTVVAYIELDNISDLSNGTFASRNKSALDAFDGYELSYEVSEII